MAVGGISRGVYMGGKSRSDHAVQGERPLLLATRPIVSQVRTAHPPKRLVFSVGISLPRANEAVGDRGVSVYCHLPWPAILDTLHMATSSGYNYP